MTDNTPKEYVAVRVELVHVKKGFLGFRDKKLAAISCIPDTVEKAYKAYQRIDKFLKKYGVELRAGE